MYSENYRIEMDIFRVPTYKSFKGSVGSYKVIKNKLSIN